MRWKLRKKMALVFSIACQAHVWTVVDFVWRVHVVLIHCTVDFPTASFRQRSLPTRYVLCHPGWITFLRFTASLNRTLPSLWVLGIDWVLFHNKGAGLHSSLENSGHSVLTYHMQGRRQRLADCLYHLETLTYVIFCFYI